MTSRHTWKYRVDGFAYYSLCLPKIIAPWKQRATRMFMFIENVIFL